MAFWNSVQDSSDVLLADGFRALLSARRVPMDETGPDVAGVYLFLADAETFFVGETFNLKQTLGRQRHSLHSEFYKDYRRNRGDTNYAIEDFALRFIPTQICRLELSEYVRAHLARKLRLTGLDENGDYVWSNAVSLWNRIQAVSAELVSAGGRMALTVDPTATDGRPGEDGPGLVIVRAPDDELIHIGESTDISAAYRDHLRNTCRSEFRQKLGEHVLGLRLRKNSNNMYQFLPEEEKRVSQFVRQCKIALVPISAGRGEIRDELINRTRPVLNVSQGKASLLGISSQFNQRKRRTLFL